MAKRTGRFITEAVHPAAAEKLRGIEANHERRLASLTPAQLEKLRRIEAICKRAAALPIVDKRTPDEIVGTTKKADGDRRHIGDRRHAAR